MRRLLQLMALLRCARALQLARPALRRTHLSATRSSLEALTVPVLKEQLRAKGLKMGGKKDDLVERLLQSDGAQPRFTAEAEPLVVDGVRVIDVGDNYDWGFDDDDDDDGGDGTDVMAERLQRATGGDVGATQSGEKPRKDERRGGAKNFAIEVSGGNCGGCGAPFQCTDEAKTGYVPPGVYARLDLAGPEADDSPEAEVEMLLAEARAGKVQAAPPVDEEDLAMDEAEFEELLEELDEAEAADVRRFEKAAAKRERTEVPICQRCHGLRHRSAGGEPTRARADASDEGLKPEAFENLIRDEVLPRKGVVLLFVDFFDVEGSLECWRKLGALVGHKRRVIVAANKADLLPNDVSPQRALNWVVRRCKETVPYLRDNLKEQDVRLVSCRSGQGIGDLLQDARDAAARANGDVFVCGAANCGKSSFVNRAVGAYSGENNYKGVKAWGVTASASPGTTLGVVKINLKDDGPDVYDTPGLLQPGALGTVLNEQELNAVTPAKLDVVTLRVAEGQCVMLGGLAKVEMAEAPQGAFFLTFYVAPTLTLHPTAAKNADAAFTAKHAGGLLSPPFDADRVAELGAFDTHVVDIEGRGFIEAAADVTLAGLGWLVVYGSGRCSLKISALPGVAVATREPLLPFEDLRRTTAKFTGGRVLRGQAKKGKKNKGPAPKKKKSQPRRR